jgi:Family of unknown function (DUF5681)
MSKEILPRPAAGRGRGYGRPFEPGRSGNPGGRRTGSRNKATLAAAALLDDEAEGLTRKAVAAALDGDMLAMNLCLERLLPRCRERPVRLRLPRIATAGNGEIGGMSPQDVLRAMNAVTGALAMGEITPGEAARIAGVYETFVRIAGAVREKGLGAGLLQILMADDDVDEGDEEVGSRAGRGRPATSFTGQNYSTYRRKLAVDLLQMQQATSPLAIHDWAFAKRTYEPGAARRQLPAGANSRAIPIPSAGSSAGI